MILRILSSLKFYDDVCVCKHVYIILSLYIPTLKDIYYLGEFEIAAFSELNKQNNDIH